jgi:flagellar capping protein FliD
VQKAFGTAIAKAFGGTVGTDGGVSGGYVNLEFDTSGNISISAANALDQIKITGMNSSTLGITPGSSNRIDTSTKLGQLTEGINGGTYKFTINGVDFSFPESDTLGTMINKINSSGAGVKVAYSSLSDSFTMEASSTGSKYSINVTQTEGNLLSQLFGEDVIGKAPSVSSSQLTTNTIKGATSVDTNAETSNAKFAINVNGTDYTFSLSGTYTVNQAAEEINKKLKDQFGTTSNGSAAIEIKDNNLIVNDGSVVTFTASTVDVSNKTSVETAKKSDLAFALGLNTSEKSNVASASTKIDDLSLTTEQKNQLKQLISGSNGQTLGDINSTGLKFENGRFVATADATNTVDNNNTLKTLFGITDETKDTTGKTGFAALIGTNGGMGNNAVVTGEDAQVSINGIDLVRSSNLFTVDGITMQLTKEMTKGDDGKYTSATITTDRDVDSIVETMRSFVNDYNSMLDKLNGYIYADATYRDYDPLTSDQKAEMSEKEIEQWEEKAKEGLLRNNSDISYFLSQMRIALYTKPSTSNYALYDIGIETSTYSDRGKLTFDETALRQALADDPESVKNLFLDSESGLSKQMVKIMDNAAKLSSASPGTLVQEAGAASVSALKSNNNLSTRISEIETKIKELQSKYETERTRYWNMFNSMETTLSNYNTQSSWLSQAFSY